VYHSLVMVKQNRMRAKRNNPASPALTNTVLIDCELLFSGRFFVGFQHNLNVGCWIGDFWFADRWEAAKCRAVHRTPPTGERGDLPRNCSHGFPVDQTDLDTSSLIEP
jgi:hypothetical protein